MNQSHNRWAAGVAAVALLGLLFYGLRTEQPRPAQLAQHTTIPTAAPSSSSGLTPGAATAATALPNFVDLVQAVKPAVVSIRVKSEVTPQVTADDGGANPFEGTPVRSLLAPVRTARPGSGPKSRIAGRRSISTRRDKARASSSAPTATS